MPAKRAAASIPVAVLALALAAPVPGICAPQRLAVCQDVADPVTLDPHKEFSERNHALLKQVYEGLVRFDPQGKVEPALAVSWERKGPLRMRFKLRKGVRFHNGDPFDAEAVRFSIERILDPRTGYPGIAFINSIARAEPAGNGSVDIVTRFPDGLLLHRLAWDVFMVPPGYVRQAGADGFARKPVGTGAFRFSDWTKGKEIVLKANREYWMKGYPKADELVFRFLPAEEQIKALFDGEIDLLADVPGTRTLKIQSHPGTRVVKGDIFYTVFCGLDFSSGPLADKRVRRALNLAVDRKALVRYDLLGNGRILASASMPKQAGRNPDLAPYPYDPAQAERLLRDAGYPGGFALSAIVNVNAERTANIMEADLKRIGVSLEKEVVAEPGFERFKRKNYHISIGGVADPMSHSYFIQSIILHSKSPFSLAKDPRYDAMLESMVSELDDARREKLARELDEYVYEEALGIFTYQKIRAYGAREDLHFTHYVSGMPYFYDAHFEK